MKPEIKKRWVAALRSGNYKQGTDVLRSNDKFCCLGVLCDLHAKETNTDWEPVSSILERHSKYLDNVSFLPIAVADWAGLQNSSPDVAVSDKFKEITDTKTFDTTSLVSLNDKQIPFNTIADLIEQDDKNL